MTSSIMVLSFKFTKPSGGTSDTVRCEKPFPVEIVRSWYDDEIGTRYVGRAADSQLSEFMTANAHPERQFLYFGQFDLAVPASKIGAPTQASSDQFSPF